MVKAVSLHLFLKLDGQQFAVCQIRGRHNFEPEEGKPIGRPESWAGALQPAVHGKLQESDNGEVAVCLLRETVEEFGQRFAERVADELVEAAAKPIIINNVAHCWVEVDDSDVSLIALHPSTGGLRLLTPMEFLGIRNIKDFPKDAVVPTYIVAMFNDDVEAMNRTFLEWNKRG